MGMLLTRHELDSTSTVPPELHAPVIERPLPAGLLLRAGAALAHRARLLARRERLLLERRALIVERRDLLVGLASRYMPAAQEGPREGPADALPARPRPPQ